MLDTGSPSGVWAVAFHPDGMHLLGGGDGGVGRWRLADGQEVGKRTGMNLRAITVSRDGKWIVCGTREGGANVWDAELHEKLTNVEGTKAVYGIDVSPDSTKFATGTGYPDYEASIWSIVNGKRLVGPLKHDHHVTGIRFSPNGDHLATFISGGRVRVFGSHGDQLLNIKANSPLGRAWSVTPLAWSNDGRQFFMITDNKKIKSFAFPVGSQLAESPILHCERSISLACNGEIRRYCRGR